MTNTEKHLSYLGFRGKDKVTGLEGVITSVSFDLFGCVMATLNPGLDKDGKQRDSHWFDIARLSITSDAPVMSQPDFVVGPQAEGRQGAADKPAYCK